ncbi:MAG: hypothetical protein KJO49_07735 [Bacteroidia bacterium]|nr:hypothetical protein [Bacteroidia bacterium]MBT8270326.1 hypothetical protein [Bacteroidia bacterium]NNF83495.1 hypothetical protein [Flavobacteriaceae bacterium]NNK70658.1 hypothetical protein [Flavobacteriaceae bacterium]NNL80086.1 hypothetical protein [Flavobacteriaceae bacterium]
MKSRLEGYWEIFEVHKDGKRIKSYTINMNIDYFELITDSTGYRKKVSPTLDGKYIVNDHQTPFFISVKDNKLIIRYQDQGVEYEEIILEVEDELLRIKNEQGFVYSYRPYEPIEIE